MNKAFIGQNAVDLIGDYYRFTTNTIIIKKAVENRTDYEKDARIFAHARTGGSSKEQVSVVAHLLEFDHCLRTGGRTRAISHIAPARDKGSEVLEKELERKLRM